MTERGGTRKKRPTAKGSPARPRGNASPRARVEARLELVAALMVRYPDAETVIAKMAETDAATSRRTVERDMAKVRKRWTAEAAGELAFHRARHKRNLSRIRDLAERKGKHATAARLAIKEAEIDGVVTTKVELGGKLDVEQKPPDLSKLSVEELRAYKDLNRKLRG